MPKKNRSVSTELDISRSEPKTNKTIFNSENSAEILGVLGKSDDRARLFKDLNEFKEFVRTASVHFHPARKNYAQMLGIYDESPIPSDQGRVELSTKDSTVQQTAISEKNKTSEKGKPEGDS